MRLVGWSFGFLMVAVAPLHADLAAAKAQANLEKRSGLALDNAEAALSTAIKSYNEGDLKKAEEALEEVKESVDLAYSALRGSGKKPTRNPRYFKNAELRTRAMLKRLASFRGAMNVADRGVLDPVRERVQQVHDDLLDGIMGGWK